MDNIGNGNQAREMADGPAFLRSLFEHASDGIVQVARDGRLHWANAALCDLMGCAGRDLIGKPFKTLLSPQDHEHSGRLMDVIQGKHRGTAVEERLLDCEKNSRWVRVSALNVNGSLSSPYHTAIVHDITERKLAEENFGSLIRGVPLPIALVGDTHQIILANSHFEKFFGYGHGEMNEHRIKTVLP